MKMRDYVERLQKMTDIELAKEWTVTWDEYRKHGRTGANIAAYKQAQEKLHAIQDVIVERFINRAYKESDE
jgi:hypothetical protein